MYKKFLLLFVLGFVNVLAAQKVFKVQVPIENLEVEQGGMISIGLYKIPENFPKKGKAKRIQKKKVLSKKVTFIFENIPAGIYAIAAHHDANENNKVDKNFLGIPKEGYGFSKNVFHTFSAPSFEETSFEVVGDTTIAPLKLKY